MTDIATLADALLARRDDDRLALRSGDDAWTWAEVVRLSAARAAFLRGEHRDGPFHVGLLLDNVAEFPLLLGAAALSGAVVVGLNTTRSSLGLIRDVEHTECELVITEAAYAARLDGVHVPVWDVDGDRYRQAVGRHEGSDLGGDLPTPADLFMLFFTSGTTSDPKAVRTTHGRLLGVAQGTAAMVGLDADDVTYCSMPLFHSNAVMAAWSPVLVTGGALALRRRFSASAFIPDVRRYGATYANYVGKPLSYVLGEPERPDDYDNPLRRVFGNEAADRDIVRFAQRFGSRVIDAYGSSEGGFAIVRTDDTPPGSLGRPIGDVRVIDPRTRRECAVGDLDDDGMLANPDEAIGELVRVDSTGSFEGYWNNPEADRERVRQGWFHSGDLGYRDADGFLYFAGRVGTWLRVDGENLAVAPIEAVLAEHPDVVHVAVYAVPDTVGDAVAAALRLRDGARFDPEAFATWIDLRRDLGVKARPRYVRVCEELPLTATNKVRTRDLVRQGLDGDDPVWERGRGATAYTLRAAE